MSLRVIDARSGDDVNVGDTVRYPDELHEDGRRHPDWWQLVRVVDYVFWATAVVQTPRGAVRVPLTVRFTHPRFPLQRVGFFPS